MRSPVDASASQPGMALIGPRRGTPRVGSSEGLGALRTQAGPEIRSANKYVPSPSSKAALMLGELLRLLLGRLQPPASHQSLRNGSKTQPEPRQPMPSNMIEPRRC